jgi:hypothetical protein
MFHPIVRNNLASATGVLVAKGMQYDRPRDYLLGDESHNFVSDGAPKTGGFDGARGDGHGWFCGGGGGRDVIVAGYAVGETKQAWEVWFQ